jgi:hypothetical protein
LHCANAYSSKLLERLIGRGLRAVVLKSKYNSEKQRVFDRV